MIDDLLAGFNPVYDVMDRRLYYEVTGCQVNNNEFDQEDTSDEEWHKMQDQDPQFYVFSYDGRGERNDDEDYEVPFFDKDMVEAEDSGGDGKPHTAINEE